MFKLAALFLAVQFCADAAAGDINAPLQNGVMMIRAQDGDPSRSYLLYVPKKGGKDAPVFVSVHGISRNSIQQAYLFAPFAERYGMVMVAPYFPEPPFWDYQFLGRNGRGERADIALERILDEVGKLTHAKTGKLYLFGYSGGGQFVHRFALVHPERVAKLAIGAAGWYTMPDPRLRYPYGTKVSARQLTGVAFDPERFLRVPAMVFVGAEDILQDPKLNKSYRVDRLEGTTRVERARKWAAAMQNAARAHGLNTEYSVELLPGAAHSFSQCMDVGHMGESVFSFFFPDQRQP